MHKRQLLALLMLSVAGMTGVVCAEPTPPSPLVVFAAASLTDALQEVSAAYEHKSGQKVILSFAASSALARQIESGSPADVFISADQDWMDYLEKRHLIDSGSRHNLLHNRLVLIAPATSTVKLKIAPHFPLAAALGEGRLAVADPGAVPAGRYAHAALTSLGVWDSVADKLAPAENVRSALAFVSRGETPLGIVYETDALSAKDARVVDIFPASSHPQIVYPMALTLQAKADAAPFAKFLQGPEAKKIFMRFGFKAER